jgi:threonine aldolase
MTGTNPNSNRNGNRIGNSPGPFAHRQFASDNYAGVCPEAWEALQAANHGHAPAYGDDEWTQKATDLIRDLFEIDCEVFFVFNGTAANSLSIASLCKSYHSILCADSSHVETDECGAPEFFSNGTKLLLLKTDNGKLTPESIDQMVRRRTDIHFPKPKVLSLTQATEVGTVYSVDELRRVLAMARKHNLSVHMDGARFANATATLDMAPKEFTWEVGVDVLCFGGTKIGMPIGDAVVFFRKELAEEFAWRCKQAGQLCSKMRYISAGWVGMLESGAWLDHAGNANAMAQILYDELSQLDGVKVLFDRQANSVFANIDESLAESLRAAGWKFYNFIGNGARFMCSWDTTPQDVTDLVSAFKAAASPAS